MCDATARKRLEVAPTVAFGGRTRHDRHGRFAEVRSMKDDAAGATELEALLRDALNDLETPRAGGSPILQLKTVPLKIEDLAPARARVPAAVAARSAPVERVPESSRLVSESVPPKAMAVKAKASAQAKRGKASTTGRNASVEPKRSRASLYAVLGLGAVALAAAGGAAWRVRPHPVAAVATAERAAVVAPAATAEGAVGIAVASRPADAPRDPPKEDAPRPEPTAFAVNPITSRVDSRPEGKPAEIRRELQAPPIAVARPAVHHAAAPRAEARPSMVPDRPAAAAAPPAAPAAPPPAPASVDALLQQQLKGAIP